MNAPGKPILLTGASGQLGRMLARHLAHAGTVLRLTDIAPFPEELPPGASFTAADLADGPAIGRLAEGCGTILHFGGISVEQPFEAVLGPNIRGVHHVYEAARRERARVVFASSNHVVGFHDRRDVLDADCTFRPDGAYALSKIFGEQTGRLYWDKHGVTSVLLRIASCTPVPVDDRMLSTWLSPGDLARLVERCVLADFEGCPIVWGVSRNARMTWWRGDDRAAIGWEPQDSVDGWTGEFAGRTSGDPVAERHMGGGFCAIGYGRPDR